MARELTLKFAFNQVSIRLGARAAVSALAAVLLASNAALGQEGVWKSLVPPAGSVQGEFHNNDPIGLAAGAEIKADCSLSWTDPTDHKLYCFSSGTSMQTFLEAPQTYISQARKAWGKLHPES
jgi:hypothetical protein